MPSKGTKPTAISKSSEAKVQGQENKVTPKTNCYVATTQHVAEWSTSTIIPVTVVLFFEGALYLEQCDWGKERGW